MVRAVLGEVDPKTQARRIAKFQPLEGGLNKAFSGLRPALIGDAWALVSRGEGGAWNERTKLLRCPYGAPSDRL